MSLLVNVMRGGISESRHEGFIVLATASGEVILSSGPLENDPISFFRSSAKPMQAIPLVESGAADQFGLTEKELALACASHNGEPEHVETVRGMLAKAGLELENLLCGPDYPIYPPAHDSLVKEGIAPAPIYNNCSGKHTGMLMVCKKMGWPLFDYTRPDHPLQQALLQVVSEFCDLPASQIQLGTDGCSVVCFGVSTARMAIAFARLADPGYWDDAGNPTRATAVRRITAAMNQYPFMVAGTGREDTDLMNSLQESKIFSKVGAEGVWCAGFPEKGLGLAFKIEDGASRAFSPIMAEILRQAQLVPAEMIERFAALQVKPLTNKRNMIVGEYQPAFTLHPDW